MLIYLAKWVLLWWLRFEGNDVDSKYHVACMKHFIGYEVPQPVKTERLV
jgi:hypothetical protein